MNPLELIPAKGRAVVALLAMMIGAFVPFILPDLTDVWQHIAQGVCAVAAIFAGAQTLSNLTPDNENPAIQARRLDTGDIPIGGTE